MEKLKHDKDYQQRFAEKEAAREARVKELRSAEKPIVKDLRAVGVKVESVWDLVNTSDPYPAALPVLLRHLSKGGYPDRVMESLGRALAVKPAAVYWEELRQLYLSSVNPGEMEGLAVALTASATKDHVDVLISLLGSDDRGSTRIHFLRKILRLGGERGLEVVADLQADETFGREATALMKRRKNR